MYTSFVYRGNASTMASQLSEVSQCSTIPYEIIENQDDQFIEELNEVDALYFQPVVVQAEEPDSPEKEENDDSDSENEVGGGSEHNYIDETEDDRKEYQAQTKFRNDTCGCKEFYSDPCSQVLEWDSIIEYREHCKELSKEEFDLVLITQLFAHRKTGPQT